MNNKDLSYLNKKNLTGTILIKEGEYNNNRIKIISSGTKEIPLTIQAQGTVIITDKTSIEIKGNHILLQGFTFRGLNGKKPITISGNNNRFTKNIIEELTCDCDQIIKITGLNNRVDNNKFRNFKMIGPIINVSKKEKSFNIIDNNTFSKRILIEKKNNQEIIKVESSRTNVYNNIFSECDGHDVILLKCNESLISTNKFMQCRGYCVNINGQSNKICKNYFVGNINDKCGGIKISNCDHIISKNTFEYLSSDDPKKAPVVIMCGDEKVERVNGLNIIDNDFLSCYKVFSIGIKQKNPKGKLKKPTNININNNKIIKCSYMFNTSVSGYEVANISNNSLYQYDQKLNIFTGLNQSKVDTESFFRHEYNLKDVVQEEQKEDFTILDDEEVDIKMEKLRNKLTEMEVKNIKSLDKTSELKNKLLLYYKQKEQALQTLKEFISLLD